MGGPASVAADAFVVAGAFAAVAVADHRLPNNKGIVAAVGEQVFAVNVLVEEPLVAVALLETDVAAAAPFAVAAAVWQFVAECLLVAAVAASVQLVAETSEE